MDNLKANQNVSFTSITNVNTQRLGVINNMFEKATVKAHTRKTKSGKLSNVKQYEDSRKKKQTDKDPKLKNILHKLQNSGSEFDGNYYIDKNTNTIRHSYYSDQKVKNQIAKLDKQYEDSRSKKQTDNDFGSQVDKYLSKVPEDLKKVIKSEAIYKDRIHFGAEHVDDDVVDNKRAFINKHVKYIEENFMKDKQKENIKKEEKQYFGYKVGQKITYNDEEFKVIDTEEISKDKNNFAYKNLWVENESGDIYQLNEEERNKIKQKPVNSQTKYTSKKISDMYDKAKDKQKDVKDSKKNEQSLKSRSKEDRYNKNFFVKNLEKIKNNVNIKNLIKDGKIEVSVDSIERVREKLKRNDLPDYMITHLNIRKKEGVIGNFNIEIEKNGEEYNFKIVNNNSNALNNEESKKKYNNINDALKRVSFLVKNKDKNKQGGKKNEQSQKSKSKLRNVQTNDQGKRHGVDFGTRKSELKSERMLKHSNLKKKHASLSRKYDILYDTLNEDDPEGKNKDTRKQRSILNKLVSLHSDISNLHGTARSHVDYGNLKERNKIRKQISEKLKQSKQLRNQLKEMNSEKKIDSKEKNGINKKEVKNLHVNYLVKQLSYGSAGEPDEEYSKNYVKSVPVDMLNKVRKHLQEMSDSGFKLTKTNLENLALGDEETLEKLKDKKYKGFNELNKVLSGIYSSHN